MKPDYFACLNERRRPWLDPELLKQTFHSRSTTVHPDKISDADPAARARAAAEFAELNAAYHCLADPKSRLRHLLELETGQKPPEIQAIPDALAGRFVEVANVCHAASQFIAEQDRTTSPLLKVRLFERGQAWIARLNQLRQELEQLSQSTTGELRDLDAQWLAAGPEGRHRLFARVEELYRLFGYLNRWTRQLQERATRIAF